jgi:glycosyltransferase involved in cell wall biosynthesis
MKIAMIGHKYVPSREGGIEVVVDELSTHMAQKGHEVTIFNRRRQYPKITEYKGCKVINIFTINKAAFDALIYAFLATIKARHMAKKGEFDVIHFHAEGPCFFLNLFPKRQHRKYKIVVTIHGLDWQRGKWGGIASKIIRSGEKKAVKYADNIIVLSENEKNYFLTRYGKETEVVPNGIDKPEIIQADIITKKYNLQKDSYILFVGRIVPEKGLDYLIAAWKQAKENTGTDKRLVIAGGDSHASNYYHHILDICHGDKSIILTGFIQGKELKELYSNAYLYVLPSDVEGMPMSLLEAMSYGNICLVSNIPENTSVLCPGNFAFEKSSTKDLESKMEQLIYKKLKTHEHPFVRNTWEEISDKTIDIYLK